MAQTETIRIRVEPKLKARAERILREVGLSPSDAVRMLYKQIVRRNTFPPELLVPNAATRRALREADQGIGLKTYRDTQEMFEDTGIPAGAERTRAKTADAGKEPGVRTRPQAPAKARKTTAAALRDRRVS